MPTRWAGRRSSPGVIPRPAKGSLVEDSGPSGRTRHGPRPEGKNARNNRRCPIAVGSPAPEDWSTPVGGARSLMHLGSPTGCLYCFRPRPGSAGEGVGAGKMKAGCGPPVVLPGPGRPDRSNCRRPNGEDAPTSSSRVISLVSTPPRATGNSNRPLGRRCMPGSRNHPRPAWQPTGEESPKRIRHMVRFFYFLLG